MLSVVNQSKISNLPAIIIANVCEHFPNCMEGACSGIIIGKAAGEISAFYNFLLGFYVSKSSSARNLEKFPFSSSLQVATLLKTNY